jgi:hypothetical protein
MFEMSTEAISKELLKEMIAKAKGRKGVKQRSDEYSLFTVRKNALPDLKGYVLAVFDGNFPSYGFKGRSDCPPDLFLRVAEELKSATEACGVSYEIGQSKTDFDPEQEGDLCLTLRHGENGWSIMLGIDELSAGCEDLEFRAGLFQSLVKCVGLSESVQICCEDGELTLESETVRHLNEDSSAGGEKASSSGLCKYWANCGFTRLNNDGSEKWINFKTLAFYIPGYNDFLAAAKRCVAHFCSLGTLVQTKFWLLKYCGDYEQLRSFLAANFPCNDWEVTARGYPRYGIDDLDKMFEETDSLLLPLFVIKDRKVGEIDVELYHSKGVPTLHFSTFSEKIDKAEKIIRQIVAELSDGKAVIDEECV